MTELYTGGLFAAGFQGHADSLTTDRAAVTVTNDRAGEFHEWLDRIFSLRNSRLLFPTDATGAETIDDALIA